MSLFVLYVKWSRNYFPFKYQVSICIQYPSTCTVKTTDRLLTNKAFEHVAVFRTYRTLMCVEKKPDEIQ